MPRWANDSQTEGYRSYGVSCEALQTYIYYIYIYVVELRKLPVPGNGLKTLFSNAEGIIEKDIV